MTKYMGFICNANQLIIAIILCRKKERMKDCHPKGKDRTKLIVVPLAGNRMKTRSSKLERISMERKNRYQISTREQMDNWELTV